MPSKSNAPYPAYLTAFQNGTLEKLTKNTFKMLEACCICPRRCRVNRLKNELGFCKAGSRARVYSFQAHQGEEPPISGTKGSGTIFFSGCNMHCVYCQNYVFSQSQEGREMEPEELAGVMLKLQDMGCHNINLVTPTHVMPQILNALLIAIPKGLNIPLVYNTSGYELTNIIKLLSGIIDIYLVDMRYGDDAMAAKYSDAPDYTKHNREAVRQMQRQVGIAEIDRQGILRRGLIIRHLVLPGGVAGTEAIMKFIAKNISPETYISLMSQYTPLYKAAQFKEISRRISFKEYDEARAIMQKYGLHNGWTQEAHGLDSFAGVNIKNAFKGHL